MTKEQLALVKKALYQAEVIRVKRIEALPMAEFTPDEEYKRKISALIEETKVSQAISLKKRLIILIAATLILSLIITACAFRNKIKGFFVDIFETFATATSDKENEPGYTAYQINSLPKGYSKLSLSIVKNASTVMYSDGKENIIFYQSIISQSVTMFDTQNKNYNTITVKDYTVYHIIENERNILFWADADYMFYISCPEHIQWEDIEKMILSLGEAEQ